MAHHIDLNLTNPGDAPATAYLYFRPIAGIARWSFLVNGSLVELGCVRSPVPYQIAALTLPPGQTRATLDTMTDGGSFYPVEVGVTATPPAPDRAADQRARRVLSEALKLWPLGSP